MTNASRRIKASELEDCKTNGVNQVIEFPIGIDGLTIIESVNAQPMKLSLRDLYAALAAGRARATASMSFSSRRAARPTPR